LDKADHIAAKLLPQLPAAGDVCLVSGDVRWAGALVEALRRRGSRVLYVYIQHSDMPFEYAGFSRAARAVDLAFGVSQHIAKRMSPIFGGRAVFVCPPNVSVPLQGPWPIEPRPLRLCFVGRLSREKRPLDLVPLCQGLSAAGVDYHLTVVGDGELCESLSETLRSLGLSPYVSLLGRLPHPDALRIMEQQHILLILSDYEGHSSVMLEGLARGVVPISTRVSGAEDGIRDGYNGFIVDVGDTAAVQARVLQLYDRPELLENMRRRCRERAQLYTPEMQRECFLAAVALALDRPCKAAQSAETKRPIAQASILERAWMPNVVVRALRKVWRRLRGPPADLGGSRMEIFARETGTLPKTVSIVMATYGRDSVLCESLRRLSAFIELAVEEILVIDQTGKHHPETEAFLSGLDRAGRIRWVQHRPPGVVGAMNRGLREAKGDIVLFLDDDIVPAPELVAAHRRVYEEFPEAWAVAGRVVQPETAGTPETALTASVAGSPGERRADRTRRPGGAVSGLRADLDFHFNGSKPAWVSNVMAGNLSVRRDRALAVGGFDENFIPPVSYRFETDFAKRLVAAGGRIRFEPAAEIRHLRAARGGTRTLGSHLTSASPLHGVGDYYYALKHGKGWDRFRYIARRPFREVSTRFHLRNPWWIPVKWVGECRALAMAVRLHRRARRTGPADGGA